MVGSSLIWMEELACKKVKLLFFINKYIYMSVKVAVRVRPFNNREKSLGCECVVEMQDPVTVLKAFKGEQERKFTFDFSFWSFDGFEEDEKGYMRPTGEKYADQKQVFQRIGKKILDNAWEGFHCCLFAYGQTGSGKSYSMIGYGSNKGIVPITCNEIFERIKLKEEGQQFEVHASMLEIYNEEVQDLTIPLQSRPKGGLKIRENKLLGVYVDGVKKHLVTSFSEIEAVMEQGTKNRTVAATQMNATSSRAHTIITVEFIQRHKVGETRSEKISMINLVDLAGSERQDKTGATGQRLKEAVGINQSLTSLGQVISVLAKNAQGGNEFVPYRNSALTRILQNALGGNSQTIMICAISPANDNYDESLSTLRYADRAKKIKNKPIVNESQSDKMIRQLKQENDRLKKLLEGKVPDQSTNLQQAVNMDSAQLAQKEEQARQKEEEFKKREAQMLKKEQEQADKLKKLEEELAKKEQEKNSLIKDKEKDLKQLQERIRAEEDAQKAEELKQLQDKMKKEEEDGQRKILQQQKILIMQQKDQQKAMHQQQLLLQKAQQDYQRFMDNIQKQREASRKLIEGKENTKQEEDDDKDDEDIRANIDQLNKLMEVLGREEKQAELKRRAKKDQEEMKKDNKDEDLLGQEELREAEKEGKLPPYFENISKDIMINRKLKILLKKSILTIGKAGCYPPNDIVFGGRDVTMKHATLHVIEGKVFLKALSPGCHLYVNGRKVTETVELVNLDRVVFGWNSAYLFKNKHDKRTDQTIKDRQITWDFVRGELADIVDIDMSDTEEGQGGCCRLF